MKVTMYTKDLTGRTRRLTLKADTFPEERLLTLMKQAIEKQGAIIVEYDEDRLTWQPEETKPV